MRMFVPLDNLVTETEPSLHGNETGSESEEAGPAPLHLPGDMAALPAGLATPPGAGGAAAAVSGVDVTMAPGLQDHTKESDEGLGNFVFLVPKVIRSQVLCN